MENTKQDWNLTLTWNGRLSSHDRKHGFLQDSHFHQCISPMLSLPAWKLWAHLIFHALHLLLETSISCYSLIPFQKFTAKWNLELKVWPKILIYNPGFNEWKFLCNEKNVTEQYSLKCLTPLMSFHVPTNALCWKSECPLSSTLVPVLVIWDAKHRPFQG